MELFDYLKFRWKSLTIVLVLGLAAILLLGQRSGGTVFTAQTELLIRPSTADLGLFASNSDRYIDTEMTLLLTPESLADEVTVTGLTAVELAASLDYAHAPDSDIVTLQMNSLSPQRAVTVVNVVAESYLTQAQARSLAPLQAKADFLQERIGKTRSQLADAAQTIEANAVAFQAANPDTNVPVAQTLSPEAVADQDLLTSRLQRFYLQQADVELDLQGVSRSRVLMPATGAQTTPGWGSVTYLAVAGGLVLLLLAAAGIGLATSRRVLGASRWAQATAGAALRQPVTLRKASAAGRQQTERQVMASLRASGVPDNKVWVVFLPTKTPTLSRRAAALLKAVDVNGIATREVDSVSDAEQPGGSETTLLLIDTVACRLDDAAQLADFSPSIQRSIIPVLV